MGGFSDTVFVMLWFSRPPTAPAESVPRESHLRFDELRLVEVQQEYESAEREFDTAHRELFDYAKAYPDPRSVLLNRNLFCRIGAMAMDPVRTKLEATEARALARRNALLAERARVMQELELIR